MSPPYAVTAWLVATTWTRIVAVTPGSVARVPTEVVDDGDVAAARRRTSAYSAGWSAGIFDSSTSMTAWLPSASGRTRYSVPSTRRLPVTPSPRRTRVTSLAASSRTSRRLMLRAFAVLMRPLHTMLPLDVTLVFSRTASTWRRPRSNVISCVAALTTDASARTTRIDCVLAWAATFPVTSAATRCGATWPVNSGLPANAEPLSAMAPRARMVWTARSRCFICKDSKSKDSAGKPAGFGRSHHGVSRSTDWKGPETEHPRPEPGVRGPAIDQVA